jgi:hypothetical protein
MPSMMRYVVARIVAALLFFASFYCVLWIVSSASLACTACNCEYSLFAPTFRCRQPYIAMILAGAFFIAAIMILVRTRRRRASDASAQGET